MIKKIFLLAICSFAISMSFAFEGEITQVFTDPETKEQKTFVWSISNDLVRFEVISGEESVIIIPDFKAMTISLYGNKADQNGNYYYSKTPMSGIESSVPKLRVLEQGDCKFNDQDAKEIKLMSQEGLLVVQYLNSIQVNMKNMLTVFAESKEFQAISISGNNGFPVSSVIMNNDEAVYTLVTKSIEEKSFSAAFFQVPSNYKLFDASSIK